MSSILIGVCGTIQKLQKWLTLPINKARAYTLLQGNMNHIKQCGKLHTATNMQQDALVSAKMHFLFLLDTRTTYGLVYVGPRLCMLSALPVIS